MAGQHQAIEEALASNHEAILRTYVQRQYDKVVIPPPVFAPPELLDDDPQDQNRNDCHAQCAQTPAASADYPPQVVLQVLLANNLTSFTEFAFGVVRPGVSFKPNWHLEAVTEKLSQVAPGEVRRLIITLPPRTLKSLCASVALPAWFLGRNPSERVVVVSYSDVLARSHANDFRRLVNHPIYQASFPAMCLERDTDREITTTQRGKRIATSIDGTLTGLGGNLIIIDDPLKLSDAMSEAVRHGSSSGIAQPCFHEPMTRPRRASFWSCNGCTRTIWPATFRSKAASRC